MTDFCCVSSSFVGAVKDFKVVSECYSDHMPINAVLVGNIAEKERHKEFELLPKLIWSMVEGQQYKQCLHVNCRMFRCQTMLMKV